MMLGVSISANIILSPCLNTFYRLNIYQRGGIAKLYIVTR